MTVCHTLDILSAMNVVCPHIIAKFDNTVVGYAMCMHPKVESYIVMGQICIAKAFRGQGVFGQLYKTLREAVQPEFKQIITEVDAKNGRSLRAHYAVGFEELKIYRSEGQYWKLLGLR